MVIAAVFGYLEIFTRGVDRLPDRPCDGAVDRATAARALPSARSAEERGKLRQNRSDGNFHFACYVRTSGGSVISGEVESRDSASGPWRDHYAKQGYVVDPVEVSSGDIRAVVHPDHAYVYVPCTPPGKKPGEARNAYALSVDARTIGKTRVHGDELRQVLADFAYQLARHTYKAADCQEARTLPEELPRLPAA
ncbi:hypothetical protein GCM10010274_49830 [Streptomyces lavendofoliae]|uniref:Uncharacterized protein n=1 Tax=Streptomyces lavendofoliae TaxID=67314 RepID=A0A918I155_9ACTN|nr:hypothetical protein GCM10010274_49830 [Streptomyces lavendofoliae]